MKVMDIGEHAFKGITFPLVSFIITANIFYVWSLVLSRGKLKQPLNVLLGFLVLCTMVYCLTLIVMVTCDYFQGNDGFMLVWALFGQYTNSSLTCYVLLNFFYYVNIVPAKRVLMVWTKKNIKSLIYVALISNTLVYLVNAVVKSTVLTLRFKDINNQTTCRDDFYDIKEVFTTIIQLLMFLCVLIMMVSSFSTAHYLVKHIRNMAKSSRGFTSPKIQSQIRVTIAGVFQGLLYLIYYILYLTNLFFSSLSPDIVFGPKVFITATTLFFSATTVSIGISQTVIRKRAADVLRRLRGVKKTIPVPAQGGSKCQV